MKAQGATIVDPANIPTAARLDACEIEVLLYELKADLNAYLATSADAVAACTPQGPHRVQRARARPRDAVLRSGALHPAPKRRDH